MKNSCIIVGAGDFFNHNIVPRDNDYVIAADGGYQHLYTQGVRTDLIIGDLDSSPHTPPHPNLVILPQEKEDTDMWAAIKRGLSMNYTLFHIYGGTGGRFDHTLANIQCVAALSARGAKAYLYGHNYIITAITNDYIEFNQDITGTISVFSYSDNSVGVTISGMKYCLDDYTLLNTYPIGVSNEFTGRNSKVSVRRGTLIIVYPQHKGGYEE